MNRYRPLLITIVFVLLGAGFVGGVYPGLMRQPDAQANWAIKVDQAPIRILALLILLGAITFAFVDSRKKEDEP